MSILAGLSNQRVGQVFVILLVCLSAACGPKYVGDPDNVVCARADATQNEMSREFDRIVEAHDAPVASFFNWVDPPAVAFDWADGASSAAKSEFVDAMVASDLFVKLTEDQASCS